MVLFEKLKENIRGKGPLAVAFSGGVDSTLVALAGKHVLGNNILGIMLVNPTIPIYEREIAARVAEEIDLKMDVIEIDVMEKTDFISNTRDRCGNCREMTMPILMDHARDNGFDTVADGANLDDLGDYRPGHEVSTRLGIWHPLIETGMGKEDVRDILKREGISVADRPSTPCLATRIPFFQMITKEKLSIIDECEGTLRNLGFRDIRMRLHENINGGLIGVLELDDPRSAMDRWEEIMDRLPSIPVFLDPKGYRQGAMNLLNGP